jgi:hypothetical protein
MSKDWLMKLKILGPRANGSYLKFKEHLLTPRKITHGYLSVMLYKNGKPKNYKIHRLVAQAFLSNPEGLPEVNHKDEDKTNNHVNNLEWCTHKYNSRYGTRPRRIKESLIKIKRKKEDK